MPTATDRSRPVGPAGLRTLRICAAALFLPHGAIAATPEAPDPAVPLPEAPVAPHASRWNGLTMSGVMVLATGYTPTVAWAALSASGGNYQFGSAWGFVPLFGPWGWELTEKEFAGTGIGAIVVADGVVQAAGAGLLVAGLLKRPHAEPVAWVPTVRVGDGVELGVTGTF